MPLATALVTGNDPEPALATTAVDEALEKSGFAHATGVLLFLTPEFARHAQSIVTEVARHTQCLQIAGGIASGVCTEDGWALDRPAAAALVFGGACSLDRPNGSDAPLLSYAGGTLPADWSGNGAQAVPRFGGLFGSTFAIPAGNEHATVWQQARLAGDAGCSVRLRGADIDLDVSRGWRQMGPTQAIETGQSYEVLRVGGKSAVQHLRAALPGDFRVDPQRHQHQILALLSPPDAPAGGDAWPNPAALIAINADGTVTLAERVVPGQRLAWAIRLPETAIADMRHSLERLSEAQSRRQRAPAAALMFSCIGRSPFFYGGEDRDLLALKERFPGLPTIGVYGTGQLAPLATTGAAAEANGLFQNAVVTALVTAAQDG